MLLTLLYMMATWMQAWRLSTLKNRLAAALAGPEVGRPSIMFWTKAPHDDKHDQGGSKITSKEESTDVLSSRFCRNRSIARLGDLLWCHGHKKLCTIFPQQKIEVSEWLVFPKGKAQFPLYVQNHGQATLNDSTKMHVLIEADAELYHPQAYAKATRLEDYGTLVAWTIDKDFAAVLETDLDHMTKLSIALMHGKCFINNGLLLTRVESENGTRRLRILQGDALQLSCMVYILLTRCATRFRRSLSLHCEHQLRFLTQSQGDSAVIAHHLDMLSRPHRQLEHECKDALLLPIISTASGKMQKLFLVIDQRRMRHLKVILYRLGRRECERDNIIGDHTIMVTGKPCVYNSEEFIPHHDNKKLIGKAQWDAHIKKLRVFSSTARQVAQQGVPLEIEELPGVLISPGNQPVTLHIPTILEIKIPVETDDIDLKASNDALVPSTPPPTPATATAADNETASNIEKKLSELFERSSVESSPVIEQVPHDPSTPRTANIKEPPKILTPDAAKDLQESISVESSTTVDRTLPTAKAPQRIFPTATSHFSPVKKPPANYNTNDKPPNIFIYADSSIATENIKNVLDLILEKDKYTVYTLTPEQAQQNIWMDQTVLVIVCGTVGAEVSGQLVEYMVRGGRLLALCSDTLHTLLPSFKTAEVREHELVRFSYGKWKHVQMMHHIFCYQASPVKTRFSQDHEDSRTTAPHTPVSANVRDSAGNTHTFHVKVLATEETWHTPSIILANLPESGGRAVFSQIHLEADPSQYEFEETKFNALKQSNNTRLEIFSDLLITHFAMNVNTAPPVLPKYSPGFFLGTHELKLEMLEQLKKAMGPNDVFKTDKMDLQFCGTTTKPMAATPSLLPIMVHQCPDNFSTVEYFENLKTKELGRLVVYADVMTSSMNVVAGRRFPHGFTVLPRQQTQGQGRNKNVWLSPMGCAMYTMQLHIPLNSELGSRLPILQHLVSVAIVTAIATLPGYKDVDLRLKWPNDIYAGSATKIGGLIVTTLIESSLAICNIGVGVNLDNSSPTCCINDVIAAYNKEHGTKLAKLSYERFLALVFNELENLLRLVEEGNMKQFFELYYKYWMHTDAEITVITSDGKSQLVQIMGIDRDGFLEVREKNGKVFTVHPDGNSFDMLKGLIAPVATS